MNFDHSKLFVLFASEWCFHLQISKGKVRMSLTALLVCGLKTYYKIIEEVTVIF